MAIRISDVNFFYGNSQALFDINLNIEKGDTVVLLGPSGAGKSTLIRTLNLLEVPQSGVLEIAQHKFNLNGKTNAKEVALLRREVGMVFQQYHLWNHLTVLENLIEAPMKVLGLSKSEAIEQAKGHLARLRLAEFADRFPLQLSGGQQQRVAIARALMMQPQVLLFDEPTAALDPEITEVIVTHEVGVARKVANKVVYMERGKVIEQGGADCFEHPKTAAFANYLSHSE